MSGRPVRAAILSCLICLTTTGNPAKAWDGGAGREPLARIVYVTVTDGQGAPITDLTAADFSVKEGGKEREIASAEPAKVKMHLALMVEERLVADGSVRMGMFEFVKRLQGQADIALIVVGIRNTTVVDYTSSGDALVGGLNQLSLNPSPVSNVTEGILEVARSVEQQKAERPVIVALAFSGGQSGGAGSKDVLDRVRQSGAVMHTVTLAGFEGGGTGSVGGLSDANNREQVLGDGPKQSGGRRVEIVTTAAASKALQQIAGDLLAQYAVRYTLPDGTKPDKRISVSVKRRGVTLRAPTVVADK